MQSFVPDSKTRITPLNYKQKPISYTLIKLGSSAKDRRLWSPSHSLGSTGGNNTSSHHTICKTLLLYLKSEIAFFSAGYCIFLGDFVLLTAFCLLTFSRLPQRRRLCYIKLHRVVPSMHKKMKQD